jgi:hypothetical protein
MIYFCLAIDGQLYNLGDHGDMDAADDTATSLGLDVVWMFGESTAHSWHDTLAQHLPKVTTDQAKQTRKTQPCKP